MTNQEGVERVQGQQKWIEICEKEKIRMEVEGNSSPHDNSPDSRIYVIVRNSSGIQIATGTVYLRALPGCCGMMVIYEPSIYSTDPDKRQKFVNLILDFCEDICRAGVVAEEWGQLLIASTVEGQKYFQCWLAKAGFKIKRTTVNPRTTNTCQLWTKDLGIYKAPNSYR